jgi:hypothetical protein
MSQQNQPLKLESITYNSNKGANVVDLLEESKRATLDMEIR